MKHPFVKIIAVVLCLGAGASARGEDIVLDTPVALSLSTAGSPLPAIAGAFAASTDDFAAAPGRTWETLPASAVPTSVVPLPEPSSETALYFLSGAVGLALVVLRRRTLA